MFKPDWSELPKEILTKISKHLTSEIDVLRFRSVCVSFRSSANLTPPLILKFPFPIIPYESSINPDTPPRFCVLLQSTVYCLRPRQPVNGNGNGGDGEGEGSSCQEWLIKVEEMRENVLRLVNPLSRVHIKPLPKTFPKVFNLSDFEIVELCNEYVLQLPESDSELEREYVVESSNPNLRIQVKEIYVRELDNLDVKKVAVLSSNPNSPSANDVYGVMVLHVGGKLAFFKPGDEKWTVIQNQTCRFNDVVQYNGKFYAVDSTGRAVVVDTSLNVSVVAVPVIGGGRKKRLVESDGILFLVDMFIDLGPDYLEWDEFHDLVEYDGDGTPFPTNYDGEATPIRCEVFKLDESKQSWVEVENLGNRVFVVGDRCSFSVPANKLSQCKGNCIIFTDNFYTLRAEDFDDVFIQSIGIYSLEEDRIGPLASYPGYNQLFWPPPSWIPSNQQ
ncbi:F-box domain [Macleaya cordata]|uniref:F-box domain n=1 Tax=Macleaya cordata TaxID=56857 RepID=A0A200QZU5_MACCD|nr:F-box domain [Macleaya cordata]